MWAQDAAQVDFDAGVSLAEEYTDNVFATSNDRRDDFVTIIAPWARLSLTGEKFSLGLDARAELGRYADYGSEDYDDYSVGADFRYQFDRQFFVFGGLDFAHEHESRSSPDAVFGIEPTVYDETSGYFGVGGRIDERRYRFGINARDLDFDDVDSISGIRIDNDDRDRTHLEAGGRIGVSKTENGEVFVQGIYEKRDYDTAVERDSDGLRAAVGYTGSIGNARGEVMLGILSQDYEDPAFDTVTAPDFGLDLSSSIGDSTRLTGIVERSLEETTLTGASGYLATSAGLRLRHRVSQNVSLAGYFFLTQNDYQQTDRTDYLAETGLSLRYYFNPRVYLDTDYSFQQRQSDAAGAEYDEHRISLRLGAALDNYYDEGTGNLASWGASSFYIGGHVGNLATQTKVDGPRGSNGFLTADFGDNSPVAGLFAGYRANLNDLVLGLEAEVEFNDGEWPHSGARNFSVERGNAYSLSAISGLRTPGNALLYGRFGAISSNFTSQYQLHSGPVVTRDESELGFLLGVGAEIPLNGGLSGRMEYQLRAYDDYWIGAPQGGAGDDNFANVEKGPRYRGGRDPAYIAKSRGRSLESRVLKWPVSE
ncbi:hypothetical protein AVO45_16915 [Ruegeria marisrubri]|uniref:Outer membrane protein beta-barrel domain-containing protein n=1 Tax=Ruegeria marisrubri TaxID=1685379 RepID=A0A0X3UAS2_9RHOB|nr:hypothetical protein AVO45_16915 [Ruegeria marisrubri]